MTTGIRVGLLTIAVLCPALAAPLEGQSEAELRAAFVHQFSAFVAWPPGQFSSARSFLTVCTLGNGAEVVALDRLIRGETIGKRKIEVKPVGHSNDIAACHVLFVAEAAEGRIAALLEQAGSKPILTVVERDRFPRPGGIVRFWLESSARAVPGIRFAIDRDAAGRAGLRISSKVLRHARSMESGPS